MSEQATDGGYSEHYVRKLKAERDRLAAELETATAKIERLEWENKGIAEWRDEAIRLTDLTKSLAAENAELVKAAEQVIIAHDNILPVMNAYMCTLGTTDAWKITCVASDNLRAALAKVKESV